MYESNKVSAARCSLRYVNMFGISECSILNSLKTSLGLIGHQMSVFDQSFSEILGNLIKPYTPCLSNNLNVS
jgi:hypothetical protein